MNAFSFAFIAVGLISIGCVISLRTCVEHSPLTEATFGLIWTVVIMSLLVLGWLFSL